MVLTFFKADHGEGDFDHIISKSVAMLGDARHSYDLATLAVLTNAGADGIAQDIRATDRRINAAELELRSELVVHVSVKGTADIGSVLAFTLLLKKIERIGDQAKNILELAENGVSLADIPETEALMSERQHLSALFTEASELLTSAEPSPEVLGDYAERVNRAIAEYQAHIDTYINSDRPGREVVPLAIYYRFHRRIAANLLGIVRSAAEPVPYVPVPQPSESGEAAVTTVEADTGTDGRD